VRSSSTTGASTPSWRIRWLDLVDRRAHALRSEDQTDTKIPEVPTAYGIGVDKEGTVWFSQMTKDGTIGKVDPKTPQGDQVHPPFRDRTRRMQIGRQRHHLVPVYTTAASASSPEGARPSRTTRCRTSRRSPTARNRTVRSGTRLYRDVWASSIRTRQGYRISDALRRQRHARLLRRQDGNVVATPPNNKVGYFYVSNRQRKPEAR